MRHRKSATLRWGVPVAITGMVLAMTGGSAHANTTTQDLSGPLTPQDLAQTLAGEGVTVSNVTFTGNDLAAGTFAETDSTVFGFDSGVILASGRVVDIAGPNDFDDTTTQFASAGDPDLDTLAGFPTYDATVLTFDFVPDDDTVYVSYVFSSEEYNEYANSRYNDVFAFYVNGTNCATVDNVPVSINTINGGNPFGTDAVRPHLYRNNDPNDPGATINIEPDGLTVGLVCQAAVNPGVPNTMKLAIADGSDDSLDSWVVLNAEGITTTEPEICNDNIDNDGDTLVDGDDPDCQTAEVPNLSIDDVTVNEDAGNATFTATLSSDQHAGVTVDFATSNGSATAGADYTATSQSLTFAAGQTTAQVQVPIIDDALDEPDESFNVTLANAVGATITDGSGTGTIVDNDEPAGLPEITITDSTVSESAGYAVHKVKLSAASTSAVSVAFATQNGSAKAGQDYTAKSGTVTIPAGATYGILKVPVTNDLLDEPNETYKVVLSNAVGGTIVDAEGVGCITDNDAAPKLKISDAAVKEGASGTRTISFTVSLTSASGKAVSVGYATQNGTAVAPKDYVAKSGKLLFAPGQKAKIVSVTVNGDTHKEATETFTVKLAGASNASILDAYGIGKILNDD